MQYPDNRGGETALARVMDHPLSPRPTGQSEPSRTVSANDASSQFERRWIEREPRPNSLDHGLLHCPQAVEEADFLRARRPSKGSPFVRSEDELRDPGNIPSGLSLFNINAHSAFERVCNPSVHTAARHIEVERRAIPADVCKRFAMRIESEGKPVIPATENRAKARSQCCSAKCELSLRLNRAKPFTALDLGRFRAHGSTARDNRARPPGTERHRSNGFHGCASARRQPHGH